MKYSVIMLVLLMIQGCQEEPIDFLTPTEAWEVINAVEEIKVIENTKMRNGYRTLQMTDSADLTDLKYTFDIMYHSTTDGHVQLVQTFFVDARTEVVRIKAMYPEGDTTTMLIDDWIRDYVNQ